jgi:hypothetical protein
LIEIPYWWDRKYESLAATVYNQRPDLFTEHPKAGSPIPLTPPSTVERTTKESKNYFFNSFDFRFL